MTGRVVFATAPPEVVLDHDVDRPLHEAALARSGIALDHAVWSDPAVRWDEYDLVVVRSVWDYVERYGEFLDWLRRLSPLGTVHNPPEVVAWNTDKRYLGELAAAGVPVIPTRFVDGTDGLAAALAWAGTPGSGGRGEVVVKPAVSAGSRSTGRFPARSGAAADLGRTILAEGATVMVQPAVDSVAESGEVAVVCVDGTVSHAVRKGPILAAGGGVLGGSYREDVAPVTLTAEQRSVAERTLAAVERTVADRFAVAGPLLYARIDLVALDDGRVAVLEVELAEPALFLPHAPGAADRFAAAVGARLPATGPGGDGA